jgi:hypothetical protein
LSTHALEFLLISGADEPTCLPLDQITRKT